MSSFDFLNIPTDRLIIRDWRVSDYKPFADMNRDPEVMRYFPKPLSEEESNEMVQRSTTSLKLEKHGFWALEEKSSGEFLGFVALATVKFECSFKGAIEIGWRLKKNSWGKGFVTEAAKVLLEYGFNNLNVDEIVSLTAKVNERSWRVMERIGMIRNPNDDFEHPRVAEGNVLRPHVLYRISKNKWRRRKMFNDFSEQPVLSTTRLILESITEVHAKELVEFFKDDELHHYVPFEPPTLEEQTERCIRWAKRKSPDGTELWLNWAARDKQSGEIAAHIQVGLKEDGVASIGYVVGRKFQRKGIATESLESVFIYLKDVLRVREVKAWSDTRNEASHRLAKKLGMIQVDVVKDADFFKGSTSDEFVFSKVFEL